jgi:hypothetical protein
METSLHRELKRLYAGEAAQVEVRHGSYRIDAIVGDELVEIQHGSLAAIGAKIRSLLVEHRVRVVKPIVAHKVLVKRKRRGGRVIERRASPKRGTLMDLFDELVYFTRVFPHERLTLEIILVDIEEWRYPGHGRRRRYRQGDFQVEDQKLVRVVGTHRLETAADLARLCPCELPSPFDTGDLSRALGIARPIAQRMAYCFREMGTAQTVGKRGNAWLYELVAATVEPQASASPRPKRKRAG